MEKGEGPAVGRRGLIVGAGAAALAALAGCSGATTAEKMDEAQAEAIASIDPGEDRLPLGSVVRALGGTWMIAGQGAFWLSTTANGGWFDYYAVRWPCGVETVYAETASAALLNKADVTELLYVGLVNDEDRDMRSYAEAEKSSDGANAGQAVCDPSAGLYDGKLRLMGYLSEELYGQPYGTGLLFDADRLAEIFGDGGDGE